MARLLARAAVRLLYILKPAQAAIGLFQARLCAMTGESMLRLMFLRT